MASLSDVVTLTTQLGDLTKELHAELTQGDVDFEKMVNLADSISEHADNLASAFTRVNEALQEPMRRNGSHADAGAGKSASAGSRTGRQGQRETASASS